MNIFYLVFEFEVKCVISSPKLTKNSSTTESELIEKLLVSGWRNIREVDDRAGEGEKEAEEVKALHRNNPSFSLYSSAHLSHLPQFSLTLCILQWLFCVRSHNWITVNWMQEVLSRIDLEGTEDYSVWFEMLWRSDIISHCDSICGLLFVFLSFPFHLIFWF